MRKPRILAGLVIGGIAALGVGVFSPAPTAAQTAEPAAKPAEHPSALYKQYCAKCHGDDGKSDTMRGRHLKAQKFTDAEWQAQVSDADLIKAVTEGHEDMPPFGKKLTAEQIESLVKNDVRSFAPKKS